MKKILFFSNKNKYFKRNRRGGYGYQKGGVQLSKRGYGYQKMGVWLSKNGGTAIKKGGMHSSSLFILL